MPRGSSEGVKSVLASVSEKSRNTAPNKVEAGSRNLWSPPISSLAMWGATKPMNPITPVKQTMAAAIKAESAMERVMTSLTFVPRVLAV